MKKLLLIMAVISSTFMFSDCASNESKPGNQEDSVLNKQNYGGFETPVKWGEHLVTIVGCNDCHTPKKMTAMGPVNDSSLLLSGHPATMPPPDVNRKEMEGKGIALTNDLTAWVGPWGISYAANITSDSTGIGVWTEDQFKVCIREGKFKGLPGNRQLLPPMPWEDLKFLQDDEIKAIFSYLKSTKPIKNVVPEAALPELMGKK